MLKNAGPSSGLDEVDRFVAMESAFLRTHFRTKPKLEFFDDDHSGQAFAIKGSETTVAVGRRLIQLQVQEARNDWTIAVAGILAHEWNHAFQYAHVLQERVFLWETHSDYMAGWYLGLRYWQQGLAGFPEIFAKLLSARGSSTGYFDPDKHGQPKERAAAMVAGFKTATEGSKGTRLDVDDAAEKGYIYAKSQR